MDETARRATRTCRYLNRRNNRCTGEAVGSEDAEIQLCARHLAQTIEFLRGEVPFMLREMR